jgi:hypothetical protein
MEVVKKAENRPGDGQKTFTRRPNNVFTGHRAVKSNHPNVIKWHHFDLIDLFYLMN